MGTGSLCAHNFCKFRAVHCFVLAAKLIFQYRVWQVVTMYTVAQYRVFRVWTQHYVPIPRHLFPRTKCEQLQKSALLKQYNKEEKEIMPLSWHIPALGVYYKRSFNEKLGSHTKPATTLPIFKRTTYYFLQERKIMAKDMLVRAKMLKVNT